MLRLVICLLFGCCSLAHAADQRIGERLPAPAGAAISGYREMAWDDLLPKNWDPMAPFKGLNLRRLRDNDPKAIEALEKMKAAWANAPAELSLNGKQIRLAGFVIPLERKGDAVFELLLVPYFGACIHVPPPPANQIVHVVLKKSVKNMNTMDAFWISGTLNLQRGDSSMGIYGYRMTADRLEPYQFPKAKK